MMMKKYQIRIMDSYGNFANIIATININAIDIETAAELGDQMFEGYCIDIVEL